MFLPIFTFIIGSALFYLWHRCPKTILTISYWIALVVLILSPLLPVRTFFLEIHLLENEPWTETDLLWPAMYSTWAIVIGVCFSIMLNARFFLWLCEDKPNQIDIYKLPKGITELKKKMTSGWLIDQSD